MINIGIRSCSVTLQDGCLRKSHLSLLKEHGFNLVELSFNSPPLLESLTNKMCDDLSQLAKKLDIKYTAHAPNTIQLSSTELAIVHKSREVLKKYIEKTNLCGAQTLVFHACSYLPLTSGKESISIKNLINSLEQLTTLCEARNVKLAIETMIPGRITSDIDNIVYCVKKINSPFIGICIDTNHVNLSLPLREAMEKAAGHIFEFHLNDNHLKYEEHLLPSQGLIDWDEFAETVTGIAFDGNMIMEPSLRSGETLETLLENARYVKEGLLNRLNV